VRIRTHAGAVRIVGWARSEVKVTTPSADWLRVTSSDDRARVTIRTEGPASGPMEVFVPSAARVDVAVVTGGVVVKEVTGAVRASSVDGPIEISGTAADVEAHAVAGNVDLKMTAPASAPLDLRASSVSGRVLVKTVGAARVWTKSVSGGIAVSGADFERVRMRSVSGPLTFEGRPIGDGPFELSTHSGSIDVTLPKGVTPSLDIHTFSGQVTKGTGAADAGASRVLLSLSSFSGGIRIKP
jgi:DUF4097 and DUF4098 domain-containing protein YvlB